MLSYFCFYNKNRKRNTSDGIDIENSNVCVFNENLSEISSKSSLYKNSLEEFYLYDDINESIIGEILNSIIRKIENK